MDTTQQSMPSAAHPHSHHNRTWLRALELVAVVIIVALAAHLRLANNAVNPGWYTDEATHIDIAQNLLDGNVQYLAIDQSVLIAARLPLFGMILSGAMGVFGEGIDTARGVTGWMGVLSVFLLWLTARHATQDRVLALLAALLLAIYPSAVLYTRIAFSYALLAPLVILATYGLIFYWRGGRGGLVLAALAIGTGLTSDLMIGSLLPPFALVILARRPLDMLWALPLAALPFGLYTGVMLVTVPDAFVYDFTHTFGRLGGVPLSEQVFNVAQNLTILLNQELWFPLGIVGLFLLRPLPVRVIAVMMFILPLLISGRTLALFNLSFYYVTPLLPLLALGLAALVRYGADDLYAMIDTRIPPSVRTAITTVILAVLVGIPAAFTFIQTNAQIVDGFTMEIDAFLLDAGQVQQIADHINARTAPDDVVIASVGVAWAVDANVTDFQMSVSYTGVDTVHFPGDLPLDRYAFDPRYETATYAVVDNLWVHWGAVHMPEVATMLTVIESEWTLELEIGGMRVYRNPAM